MKDIVENIKYYTDMLPISSEMKTYLFLGICILILIGTLWLFRKLAANDNKNMLEDQAYAIQNPNKIEKIKLVDHREICCVATIQGKGSTIIAYGVQAVRVFDKLVQARPDLAK